MLLGLALSTHYPHIQLLSFLTVVAAFSAAVPQVWRCLSSQKLPRLFAAALLMVLSAAPLLALCQHRQEFASPLRQRRQLEATSLADYVKLNRTQISSAPLRYFANYFRPTVEDTDDRCAFYVTVIGLLCSFIGMLVAWRKALPITIILAVSAWCAYGVRGYAPQILYQLHFPLIHSFRQWYHFVPVVNFALSALAALAVAWLVRLAEGRSRKLLVYLLCGMVIVAMGVESREYFQRYQEEHLFHGERQFQRFSRAEFLTALTQGYFSRNLLAGSGGMPIFLVYRPYFLLSGNVRRQPHFISARGSMAYALYPDGLRLQGESDSGALLAVPFAYQLGLKAVLNGKPHATVPLYDGGMTGISLAGGKFDLRLSVPVSFFSVAVFVQLAVSFVLIVLLCLSVANARRIPDCV